MITTIDFTTVNAGAFVFVQGFGHHGFRGRHFCSAMVPLVLKLGLGNECFRSRVFSPFGYHQAVVYMFRFWSHHTPRTKNFFHEDGGTVGTPDDTGWDIPIGGVCLMSRVSYTGVGIGGWAEESRNGCAWGWENHNGNPVDTFETRKPGSAEHLNLLYAVLSLGLDRQIRMNSMDACCIVVGRSCSSIFGSRVRLRADS